MTSREAHLLDRFLRGAQPVDDDLDVGAQLAGALGSATCITTLQLLPPRSLFDLTPADMKPVCPRQCRRASYLFEASFTT
jgi:hypothetical protein